MAIRCPNCLKVSGGRYCSRCGAECMEDNTSTTVAHFAAIKKTYQKPIPKNASDAWVARFLGWIVVVVVIACFYNGAGLWGAAFTPLALYMLFVPQPNPDLKMNKIKCPHCHEQGGVRTKRVRLKKGVSGAKATGAILTGGVSLLVTGLSRKEDMTEATCNNCGQVWHY